MAGFTRHGVPRSIARDAWWLSAPADGKGSATEPARPSTSSRRLVAPFIGLLIYLTLTDWLIWSGHAFGSLPALFLGFGTTGVFALVFASARAQVVRAFSILTICSLPLLAHAQFLSVVWWITGCAMAFGVLIGWGASRVWIPILSAPFQGFVPVWRELPSYFPTTLTGSIPAAFLRNWGLAIGLGLVFAMLFLIANPMAQLGLDNLLGAFGDLEFDIGRVLFWAFFTLVFTFAIAAAFVPVTEKHCKPRTGGFSDIQLRNALAVFCGLFAAQLLSDLTVLFGDASVMDAATLANYAHRGAYPLVFTALLAGLFMIISRRAARTNPIIKILLAIWVMQNAVLLCLAAWRLAEYTDSHGLTYLRIYAGIWMAMVLAGLGMVGFDLWHPQDDGWLIRWNWRLTLGVLYGVCFVSFSSIIVHNFADRNVAGKPFDTYYLCSELSDEAGYVIMAVHRTQRDFPHCRDVYLPYRLIAARDWRDFDLRLWQLERNLGRVTREHRGGR